jgi:transposase
MDRLQLDLAWWQRRQPQRQLHRTRDAAVYRRTRAVLEFARGQPAAQVAERLGVARPSVYNWVAEYAAAHDPQALRDRDRPGRPTAWTDASEAPPESLLRCRPSYLGYFAGSWAVPLLQEQLRHWTGQVLAADTIRRRLRRLGYAWKRSRYVLAPDPDLETKTAPAPANPAAASPHRAAGGGRDRPAAVPAAARGLVAARRAGGRAPVREERPPGGFRGAAPAHGAPAVPGPAAPAGG